MMCYVGKATKIFIFIIAVLAITGIVIGFGIIRHNVHPKSHKCSGEYCSFSDYSPPPLLQIPVPSLPDPNASNPSDSTVDSNTPPPPTALSETSFPPPPPLPETSLPPPPPPPLPETSLPPPPTPTPVSVVTAAPPQAFSPPSPVQVSPGPMNSS